MIHPAQHNHPQNHPQNPQQNAQQTPAPPDLAKPRDNRDTIAGHDPGPSIAVPVIEKSRWTRFVWIVPALAAVATGFYVYKYNQMHGRDITIRFFDAHGVKPSDTAVVIHGVEVGSVTSVDVAPDFSQAIVHARLHRSVAEIARQNTRFFIDRPDFGSGGLSGVTTLIRGPVIEVIPGDGPDAREFDGLEKRPIMQGDGIRIIMHTSRIERLSVEAPIMYRGFQVGTVQDIRLSDEATQVNVTGFIFDRYIKLVRPTTEFWVASGTDVKGGVLSGIKVQLGSIQTLLTGGIEFATPPQATGIVKDGEQFTLHDEPKKDWLAWESVIDLPADPNVATEK